MADVGSFKSWKTVEKINLDCDCDSFFTAIQVWIDKPHVVNRRLNGSVTVKRIYTESSCVKTLLDKAEHVKTSNFSWDHFLDELQAKSSSEGRGCTEEQLDFVEVLWRRLIPRQLNRNSPLNELVILGRSQREVYFLPLYIEDCKENPSPSKRINLDQGMQSYKIVYLADQPGEKRLQLQVFTSNHENYENQQGDGVVCPSVKWLREQLLIKIKKWAESPACKNTKGSLRLIPMEKYTMLYQKMKEKHGERLVKSWPESTDPQKFVYEDIAIATYLLILWENERAEKNLLKKQSFVDLGCGNGLLVHLLTAEGHAGEGIDVRKRNIWDFFGPETRLKEQALDPTASGLFPEVDWLIGNHSDELTPWLPVIAARSSYNTRYFVLPCCLYDFNCKFVRRNNISQYRDYLNYIQEVGTACGFYVEEDVLRIPSTKRTCQVGKCRAYSEEEHPIMEVRIKDMIRSRGCDIDKGQQPQTISQGQEAHRNEESNDYRTESLAKRGTSNLATMSTDLNSLGKESLTSCNNEGDSKKGISPDFVPRSSEILSRNCSQLQKAVREFMVSKVAEALLSAPRLIEKVNSCDGITSTGTPIQDWNPGGRLTLSEIVKIFDKETLQRLKSECGGIQTLLRNHRYVFKVVSGTVELRDWRVEVPGPKMTGRDPAYLQRRYDALYKTTTCWFHSYHPDGCCSKRCPYAHGEDELRDRPSAQYLKAV